MIPLRLRQQAARASRATHPCTSIAQTRGRFAIAAEPRVKISCQSVDTTHAKRISMYGARLRPVCVHRVP